MVNNKIKLPTNMKSSKQQLLFLFFLCSSLLGFSQDEVIGTWLSESKEGKTEIYKKDGKYYGKLIWLKEPKNLDGTDKIDQHNPNHNLRQKPLIGLNIINGLTYKNKKWTDGSIYDPKTGKSYDCTLMIENGKLLVRGYIGWFFETRNWTRVN